MALVACPPFAIPRWAIGHGNGLSVQTQVLDAVGEKYAFIFTAPKTGTIDQIEFATGSITTGGTLDVRVESVDMATGAPSGTLLGTNTNGSCVVADTDDGVWKTAALTSGASVTAGDYIAVVIVAPSGFNGQVREILLDTSTRMPYTLLYTVSWSKSVRAPFMAVRYSDGSYPALANCYPVVTMVNTSLTTSALQGLRISLPFPCTVSGLFVSADADQDLTLTLYDSDGTTVLATASIDTNVRQQNDGAYFIMRVPPVNLAANTVYRVAVKSTSSNGGTVPIFTLNAAALVEVLTGLDSIYGTSAATATPSGTGDWTDDTTSFPMVGVIVSQIDDGTGGGGAGAGGAHILGGTVVR